MKLHPNAKSTPKSRELMVRRVRQGERASEVAESFGVSERTVYKWLKRHRENGPKGLQDRGSAPHCVPRRTSRTRVQRILGLRAKRLTAWQIAQKLKMPWSTVSAVLRREGVGEIVQLEKKPPVQRYEKARQGELVHFDIKRLARILGGARQRTPGNPSGRSQGAGWEYVHVAIDDATRLAYVEVLPDQKSETARAFFERALRWFRKRRIVIEKIFTDNGGCYVSRRFRQAVKRHGVRHGRTRPHHPQSNGKAERFIQTLIRGWAKRRLWGTSNQRTKALTKWLRHYNEERPHRSLGMKPPATRLRELNQCA